MQQPEKRPELSILAHTPTHLYIAPHPLLRPYIAHYTFCAQGAQPESLLPEKLTLIPDASGCVVFSYDGRALSGCFWGPTTKTVVVFGDAENIPLRFFIEFLPGGANRLLGLNLKDFTDRREPLDLVCPSLSIGIKNAFEQSQRVAYLSNAIDTLLLTALAEMPGNPRPLSPILKHVSCQSTVSTAAEKIGYSERHLQRLITEALGMRYKTFTRLTRINLAMQRMEKDPVAFTKLAHTLGYYDQSHFNHDFKAVCGISPTKYYAHMSDFYNESYKF
ncbi:helix-turn-helix domain-containing protein [Eubacterium callanderi]|uniref:helix-turn-helix domain-containing protein n=1 Tax=Eubacterium callanderi TaxID=53442 RepID=UPI001AA1A52D|nr:helix-turn-helix transcriptional regulator [Eubacterium callanderi]MBO1704111.1 helix-turn-helix transcriptional regulator [Eubacterium callanderi]MDR4075089.1 helix-turn-helix transcriptional regulator [Eubacterium sp.]